MRKLTIPILLIVLIITLVLSFYSAKSPSAYYSQKEFTIFDVIPTEIQKLVYSKGDKEVTIYPKTEGTDLDKLYVWIEVKNNLIGSNSMTNSKVDTNLSQSSSSNESEIKSFKGNKNAQLILEAWAPLKVLRALGEPTKEQLISYSLDKDFGTINIKLLNEERKYNIGKSTFGNKNYYIQDSKTNLVYFVKSSLLSGLVDGGMSLQENRLLNCQLDNLDKLAITYDSKKKVLIKYPDQMWKFEQPEETAQADIEIIKNILTMTINFISKEYICSDNEKDITKYSSDYLLENSVVEFTLLNKNKEVDKLFIYKKTQSDDKVIYYAKSNFTHGITKIENARAEDLLKKITEMFNK